MALNQTTWSLRTGADRRIRAGHPWIFSNELSVSPKGHPPGQPVILRDSKGGFLAAGYGNPNSLIAFRALSFDASKQEVCEPEFLLERLLKTWWQRKSLGFETSFRLCYGEGDFTPGLVIDRYLVEQNGKKAQVFAVQVVTYGMSEILKDPLKFFEEFVNDSVTRELSPYGWEDTAIVMRNDVGVRKLEGLDVQKPNAIKEIPGMNLTEIDILLSDLPMETDLVEGQKTGFFLDQAYNIQLLCDRLKVMKFKEDTVRVLDLCCYVGQWSTKITKVLKERGLKVEVTAADSSEKALAFAKKNLDRQGAIVNIRKMDVMTDLGSLPDRYFDIVIADPPAFIKAKKDVPVGKAAYLKLNSAAFKLTKLGGLVVSCSCSGLFIEEEMMDVLRKSIQRGTFEARCIIHGGHSPDHPVLLSFNEGFYLKMFVHQII